MIQRRNNKGNLEENGILSLWSIGDWLLPETLCALIKAAMAPPPLTKAGSHHQPPRQTLLIQYEDLGTVLKALHFNVYSLMNKQQRNVFSFEDFREIHQEENRFVLMM